jgi:hypothetical protein
VQLIYEKTRGRKSRDTVSLKLYAFFYVNAFLYQQALYQYIQRMLIIAEDMLYKIKSQYKVQYI